MRLVLLVALSCSFSIPLMAQLGHDFSSLQGEVWSETAPFSAGVPGPVLSKEQINQVIVESARQHFSGMIYGFRFDYRPSDTARQISEEFNLKAIALIPYGNPGFEYLESRQEATTYHVAFRYQTNALEQQAMASWYSAKVPNSSGIGKADYFIGIESRLKAFELACKEAVRTYGRFVSRNKPARIQGRLGLIRFPRFRLISGQWVVDVDVRLIVETLEPYRVY